MLNEHLNEFSVDSGLTQIASYFNIVDNAVKTGDTNKRYAISSNASTAPSCPFNIGSWTSFVISPQGDNMCDLFNSYLTVDFHLGAFTGTFPSIDSGSTSLGFVIPGYWVGFKDSMDAIEQYQILANGQSIYTQSNAIEESYITHLASTEAVKHVDVYSKVTHEDAWLSTGTHATGVVINNTNKASDHIISLKIDIRRFLPLASVKYLPEFVGNIELRVKWGISGLVCTPLSHEYVCANPFNYHKAVATGASSTTGIITNKFVPFNELEAGNVRGITGVTESSGTVTLTSGIQSAIVMSGTPSIQNCFSHLACFGLDDNLYQQLIQRYMKESLSFPIQTLTFNQMNGNMGGAKTANTFSLTVTPRFVDTIFVLFPKNTYHHTCYENPLFSELSLKMGGYGSVPEVPITTTGPEFYELVSNAFNTNNDLTGFNKDVMKSLTNTANSSAGWYSYDVSNFVLAFPTSTDNTFQQGQTSNTPITYQLKVAYTSGSPYYDTSTCNPIMGFLKDSVLAIQLRPSGPPIISLDEYDITSPAE